jgi:UrcA family protein
MTMTPADHRPLSFPGLMLAIAAALLAAVLSTAPARADSAFPSVVVQFDDLNLDTAPGVARLYKRLHVAAEQVCDSPVATGSRFIARDWRQCIDAAVDRAVKQVDRPAVTAYHLARLHPTQAKQTAAVNDDL